MSSVQSKQFCFTKKAIEELPPHSGGGKSHETEYSDTKCPGLKILVNRKGNKVFYCRYTVPNTRGKKRGVHRVGTYPGTPLSEARQRNIEIKAMVDRGIDPQAERRKAREMPTFKAFAMEQYLPHAENTKRSYKDDRSRLEHHLLPEFGEFRLNEITRQLVQVFLGNCLRKGLAPATVNRMRSLGQHIFSLAVQWGVIDKNPVQGIPKLQENNQRQRLLNPAEKAALRLALDEEPNVQAVDAILLLWHTGARVGELLNARHEDVDLDAGVWTIPRSKSGRRRYVNLGDVAKAMFARQTPRPGNPYVFPGSPKYGNARMASPTKAFERVKRRAGLENLRLHDLRHNFASEAVGAGFELYDVQNILGHSNPSVTQRYCHLTAERLKRVSDCVADALSGGLVDRGRLEVT